MQEKQVENEQAEVELTDYSSNNPSITADSLLATGLPRKYRIGRYGEKNSAQWYREGFKAGFKGQEMDKGDMKDLYRHQGNAAGAAYEHGHKDGCAASQ